MNLQADHDLPVAGCAFDQLRGLALHVHHPLRAMSIAPDPGKVKAAAKDATMTARRLSASRPLSSVWPNQNTTGRTCLRSIAGTPSGSQPRPYLPPAFPPLPMARPRIGR